MKIAIIDTVDALRLKGASVSSAVVDAGIVMANDRSSNTR